MSVVAWLYCILLYTQVARATDRRQARDIRYSIDTHVARRRSPNRPRGVRTVRDTVRCTRVPSGDPLRWLRAILHRRACRACARHNRENREPRASRAVPAIVASVGDDEQKHSKQHRPPGVRGHCTVDMVAVTASRCLSSNAGGYQARTAHRHRTPATAFQQGLADRAAICTPRGGASRGTHIQLKVGPHYNSHLILTQGCRTTRTVTPSPRLATNDFARRFARRLRLSRRFTR